MVQKKKENVEASSLLILNNWRYLFGRSFLYMYHNPGQFLGDSMVHKQLFVVGYVSMV